MTYYEEIEELASNVPLTLIDFSQPRSVANAPTQASSNFITNKEQGDWAEKLLIRAINGNARNYVAVKYGKSDNLVAGEPGFDNLFRDFQKELDEIGKRPDLLIFRRGDFDECLGYDISRIHHNGRIDNYVSKAIAGIEVRSSAFLIEHYEDAMIKRIKEHTKKALAIKDKILNEYIDILSQSQRSSYIDVLNNMNERTLAVADFKVPGWRASKRLLELNNLLRQLKSSIKEIQKRDFLSITPKAEDLKVVYKWIQTFNVPHFYFQVFFDKIYGISFKRILELISNPENEGIDFFIESDIKNQNKTTIKIRSKAGTEIAYKIDEPEHHSIRREMDRGRLLFYITFNGGTAYLDVDNMRELLNISDDF